ncbi:PREDICTED: uncharacterized protein LOC109215447 [Nicotiana attenuata]|uniref:DC1 domain-containing protein n=1 Tax=Nicotiana attenuata TaxID=49451 RepID=A0A1J6L5A5_NICAT|nr:PREDICTED: uncharacterized protein LOC109215447 [Nicotiana attenuata]OIT26329.1 hypothetical protein A4A49_42738 [Nicotiana attenuata]
MYVNCSSSLNRKDDDDDSASEFPRMIRNSNQLRANSVHNPRRPVVDYSESEDEGQAQWFNHNKPPRSTNDISSLLRMMLNLRQGAGAGAGSYAGRTSQLIINQNRRPVVDYSDTDDEVISAHYRQIKHFSHPHALNKYDVERDDEIKCKVCGLQLVGSAYGCQPCQFYLHVSCFDLPQKIKHDSHPAHPLTLRYPSYYKNCGKSCDACCEDIRRSFLYCCDPCNFDLHVTCATLYSIAKRADSPKDTLRLYYSFPLNDNNHMHWIARCNVCNKKVSKEGWLYYSRDTGYIAHIKCAKGAKVGVSWIKERLNMLKVK